MTGVESVSKSNLDATSANNLNIPIHDPDQSNSESSVSNIDTNTELQANFHIIRRRKNNIKIQVKLTKDGIYLRRETEQINHINEQLIRIEDIVGSHFGSRQKKNAVGGGIMTCKRPLSSQDDDKSDISIGGTKKDISAYLYIYAYLKEEKPLRRLRTVRILRFRTMDHYEDNLKLAENWHNALATIKQERQHEQQLRENNSSDNDNNKHLLILLNPKSGSGKAREMFHKEVASVLKEAELQYDLQITAHANYAKEFIRSRKDLLQRYNGIVVASGDGLLHEVINGIMERTDWQMISRYLPLGIIPCGSGNGLAKSISFEFNEPYEPNPITNATLNCVSRKTTPLDIARVEILTKSGKKTSIYSFLSVGWGFIADVDIESERLRSIGAQRFTLWTIHRLIKLRTYKGKLYYLPWRKANQQQTSVSRNNSEHRKRSSKVVNASKQCQSADFFDVPSVNIDDVEHDNNRCDDDDTDEFADVVSLDRSSIKPHTDSWHSAFSRRTAYYSCGGQSTRSKRSMTTSVMNRIDAANAEWDKQSLKSSLPPLNTEISLGDWRCEDGEFVMVHGAYISHLASDCHFATKSKLNDGIIYLTVIRAGVSRSQLMNFMLGLSTGTHMPNEPNEFFEEIPVTAFRIEPTEPEDGIMNVDGERVDYGQIQCEIFPGMLNVMVPNV